MREKNKFKKDRLAEKILYGLNLYLRTELKDSKMKFVSFTKVELSPDNSVANLYWDTFDNATRGDAKKGVEAAKGKFRRYLALALKMRAVPELLLHYDAQYVSQKHIEDVMKQDSLDRESDSEE